MPRVGQTYRRRLNVDAFPVALGYVVQLVEDGEMRMRVDYLAPPVPAVAVRGPVGKVVHAVGAPEIKDCHDFVVRTALGADVGAAA